MNLAGQKTWIHRYWQCPLEDWLIYIPVSNAEERKHQINTFLFCSFSVCKYLSSCLGPPRASARWQSSNPQQGANVMSNSNRMGTFEWNCCFKQMWPPPSSSRWTPLWSSLLHTRWLVHARVVEQEMVPQRFGAVLRPSRRILRWFGKNVLENINAKKAVDWCDVFWQPMSAKCPGGERKSHKWAWASSFKDE